MKKDENTPLARALERIQAPSFTMAERERVRANVFSALEKDKTRPAWFNRLMEFSLPVRVWVPAAAALIAVMGYFSQKADTGVHAGMRFVTTMDQGRSLRLDPGVSAELGLGSDLEVSEVSTSRQSLFLHFGTVFIDADKRPSGGLLEVVTENALCRVVGTAFRVETGPAWTRLTVMRGRVRFISRADTSLFRDIDPGKTDLIKGSAFYAPPAPVPAETRTRPNRIARIAEAAPLPPVESTAVLPAQPQAQSRVAEDNVLWETIMARLSSRSNARAAEEELNRYLAEFPDGIWIEEAFFKLAELRVQAGRKKEALEVYRRFINRTPAPSTLDRALYEAATILANDLNGCAEAVDLYGRIESEYPSSRSMENTLFWRGDCFTRLGRLSEAQDEYRKYAARFSKGKWAKVVQSRLP